MILAPDFREKQIFFLESYKLKNCEINLKNETINIKEDGKTKERIPINRLIVIFIVGDTTISTKLMQKITKNGASVFFLKRNYEMYASICSYAEGNYLLRQKQYNLSEEKSLEISKNIVKNKLRNSLALLRNAKISKMGNKSRMDYKKIMVEKIKNAKNISSLRGIEGVISKDYFSAYFASINWYKRIPRGKIDPNNILLDMGYSYLFNFVDSVLRVYGFDTYKGIYHQLFFQRKSLSCDMMEPFRCIIDKSLVKMHNLEQFDKKDFNVKKGKYYLSYKNSAKYSKIFLKEILKHKMDIYSYIREHYYLILNDEGKVKDFVIR